MQDSQAITLDDNGNIKPIDFDTYTQGRDEQRRDEQGRFTPAGIDNEQLIANLREQVAVLQAQAAATSQQRPIPTLSAKAPVTFDQMMARNNQWGGVNNMSREAQAAYLGADPSVSDERLREIFGRGASAQVQNELNRANPANYAILREFAKARRVYGA